ncbi:MAG: hypothetical protein ACFB4I_05675 [Cyanophyceae cyanobacterium]
MPSKKLASIFISMVNQHLNKRLIEMTISKEILWAGAKEVQLPINEYIHKLIHDQEFIAPTLSDNHVASIKLKVILFFFERELTTIKAGFMKLEASYLKGGNTSRIQQINTKINMLEEILKKMQKLRLEVTYHFS